MARKRHEEFCQDDSERTLSWVPQSMEVRGHHSVKDWHIVPSGAGSTFSSAFVRLARLLAAGGPGTSNTGMSAFGPPGLYPGLPPSDILLLRFSPKAWRTSVPAFLGT
jgi:hypothetical protein